MEMFLIFTALIIIVVLSFTIGVIVGDMNAYRRWQFMEWFGILFGLIGALVLGYLYGRMSDRR